MAQRADLKRVLNELGFKTYFDPPEDSTMDYPCIVYNLDTMHSLFSNNKKYKTDRVFQITYITYDADDPKVDVVNNLPYCKFDRPYTADGLYHFVFTITI